MIGNVELICARAGDVHASAVPALTAANETVKGIKGNKLIKFEHFQVDFALGGKEVKF